MSSDQMKGEKSQMKSESLKVHMTDEMKSQLENVSEKSGLGMSSIARRGIFEQVRKLETEDSQNETA